MNATGQALFQVVCMQPWDDTVRLIYADWLEEHGDLKRSEFIRFQCAHPQRDPSDPQYFELLAREGQFEPVKSAWLKELPRLPGVKWLRVFRRGFISTVKFQSARAFTQHAAAVFAATPLDHVQIAGLTARTLGEVLASDMVSRLRGLFLCGRIGDEGLRRLAACAHLRRVENLWFWYSQCGDAGAQALAHSPHLPHLRCLSFLQHRIRDQGARALADSSVLQSVRELNLHGTDCLSRATVDHLKQRFDRLE